MTTGLATAVAPVAGPATSGTPRLGLFALLAVNALALVAFARSPFAAEYPAGAVGIVAFLLVQLLLPACRPVWHPPLCPANVAQAFFWVQLVLVPLLIGASGLSQGTLPRLPGAAAVETGMALRVVGYVAFCVAYQLRNPAAGRGVAAPSVWGARATFALAFFCLAVGALGLLLANGGVAGYVEYLTSPIEHKEREQRDATLATAAGSFLKPYLGFGLVLLWGWWVGRRRRGFVTAGLVTLALLVLLLFANFSYNRGSMLAPLVAVVAAFSAHVRRIPFPAILAGGLLALSAALSFGWYRSTDLELGQLSAADLGEAWSGEQVAEFVQVYASGPQMTAFLIEERADAPLALGRTLVGSALYPVPVLGKAFREGSGVGLLNMLIYQDPDVVDQVIAYDAELFINFHLPGVALGYGFLGWLVTFFQGRFLRAARAVESYAWLLLGLWVVFPGSLPVISQMCVYFFSPVYLYFALGFAGRVWFGAPRAEPAAVPSGGWVRA